VRELFGARDTDRPDVKTTLIETLRRWRRGRISLRSRITGAFTLVVVGGTAVSTLIGSRIITNALLSDARSRAEQGLEAALVMYAEDMDATIGSVARAAEAAPLREAAIAGAPDRLNVAAMLRGAAPQARLDFLGFVPGSGQHDPCLESTSFRTLIDDAAAGRRAGGAEVLTGACLSALDPALAARARIHVRTAGDGSGGPAGPVTSALALVSAARVADGSRLAGVVYGGVLLNRRTDVVDRVKRMVYGEAKYGDRDVGSASIFLGDVRVATSARTPANGIGTRATPDVTAAVLAGGARWHGRTRMIDDWCIAAYEPLRDYSGHVIGMMYVGMLEAPILAVRTDVMLTFLAVCAFGLAIVFALTYLITRRTISPLEEMVDATKKIAGGDLAVRVSVVSDDEIGDLAKSFNNMLASLEATKRELEEWGHTLEDKVKERTDQLVTVQAQMVRSEKLASIGRLAAGVAHSINNPLGGILSLSMLAAESCTDPALGSDLDTISRQALRCREIVKGLLDFSHQSDVRVTRTDVNAIIHSAVQLLQRQAVFHNVSIERRFDRDAPRVLIDPGQLQDAVTNLLVNAVDAMENGGTVAVETVAVRDAGEVLIRVADTGCGIPEQNLPYLFEPFFTTKKVGKGTGLGLAIVHGIVTGAGGSIEVGTGPSGTTFTIHLPVTPAESEADAGTELAGARAGESAGGR
jgi:two-component system NtrC family sensor kinase